MISSLELARLCGVSQGTVDRALHNRRGISAATRRRVLALAAKHGYVPNPAARELMTGRSRLVGALIPAINSVFFMDLMGAIREALAGEGLRLMLTPVTDVADFHEALGDFAARRLRAAVAVPPEEDIPLSAQLTRRLKVVSLLSPVRAKENTLFLAPDEIETGRMAVAHLAAMGHRRIMHLSYNRPLLAIRDRERGYTEAMQKLCPGVEPVILREFSRESLAAAINRVRPTAFFCHNDWLALQTLRFLAETGLFVPRDVSVLGVDHSPTFQDLHPGLSSLAYPYQEIAARAAAWIAGRSLPETPLACTPVTGETVGSPP